MWDDLAQVWHVIDKGDTAWSVPPYNGGLFGCDPELQPEGALLERINVTQRRDGAGAAGHADRHG